MTIVVDASIALKWVLEEPGSDAAEELLEKDLAAPSLWLLDAANALWRRTVRGGTNGRRNLGAADRTHQGTGFERAASAGPSGGDAPRPPAQSPGLRLSLSGAREAPGDLRRHRRHPVRAGSGQSRDAHRAHSDLVADSPERGFRSVALRRAIFLE